MGVVPSGWYADPDSSERQRWWSGTEWTDNFRVRRKPFPWRRWLVWLIPIGVAALVCFGKAEDRTTPDPDRWFAIGLVAIAILSVAAAVVTLRGRGFLGPLVLGCVIAVTVSIALLMVADPASSRSCNGQTDCDTSFGLGLPFLVATFAVPVCVLTTAGWLVVRRRESDIKSAAETRSA